MMYIAQCYELFTVKTMLNTGWGILQNAEGGNLHRGNLRKI